MNAFDRTVKALREQGMNSSEILETLREMFQKFSEDVSYEEKVAGREVQIIKILKK